MKGSKYRFVDLFLMLSLFCVFAATSLLTVILGADIYKGVSGRMEDNYNARIAVGYVTEKVRQSGGNVDIMSVSGNQALVLRQDYNGISYETWIYVENGRLMEATTTGGAPQYGESIMNAAAISLEKLSDQLLGIRIADENGKEYESAVFLQVGSLKDKV